MVINANGVTSKVTWSKLLELIIAVVTPELTELENRVQTLEGTYSTLATTTANNSDTINNIITAGFNLIGIE